jgi:hypothetical protein
MSSYLVEFQAVIGRKKLEQADNDASASMHPPVQLKYVGIVDAVSIEDVNDKIVLYRDPGFVTSVVKITDLKDLDMPALASLLALGTLVTEL